MKNSRLFAYRSAAIYVLLLLTVSLTSCGIVPQTSPQSGDAGQSPVTVEATPGDSFDDSGQMPVESDPSPTVPEEESQDFSDVIDDPIIGGVMVLADNQYSAMDHFGQPMGFAADAAGQTWVYESVVGVTKKFVFLGTYDGLELITTTGRERIAFAGTNRISSVAVSRDGSLLAWVSEEVVENGVHYQLWAANIDGSNPLLAYELGADQTRVEPIAPEILGWTADNQVIFATRADGLGGYILYNGWIDLFAFDPARQEITSRYISDDAMKMCVSSVSNDFSLAAVGCHSIQVQNLITGEAFELPIVADQNFAGSAQFSPSNKYVAYSISRGDPENERSQLLVAPVDGTSPPTALDTIEGGYFTVLGWADENTVLYRSTSGIGGSPAVWRTETDDSHRPFKIADGLFVGFIY